MRVHSCHRNMKSTNAKDDDVCRLWRMVYENISLYHQKKKISVPKPNQWGNTEHNVQHCAL